MELGGFKLTNSLFVWIKERYELFLMVSCLHIYFETLCGCLISYLILLLMQTLSGVVYFETELDGGSSILEVAKRLISGGLECKLLSIFEDLLSSKYPEQMVV